MFFKLPFAVSFSVLCIYIYVVATTKEFSENKVLNIANVELLQLKLHLLPHVVTLCFIYADDDLFEDHRRHRSM